MRDVVYLASFAVLIPLILYRPWFGILAWSVLGLINPQVFTWHMQDFQFAMWVGGATLLGLLYTRDRRSIPLTSQTLLLGLLAVWFTVTTLQAWLPDQAWDQW